MKEWGEDLYCQQVSVDPSGAFVVVSYVTASASAEPENGFIMVHLRRPTGPWRDPLKGMPQVRFDYLARFPTTSSICSLAPQFEEAEEGEEEEAQVNLYCVHTHHIQQYHVQVRKEKKMCALFFVLLLFAVFLCTRLGLFCSYSCNRENIQVLLLLASASIYVLYLYII